MKAMRYLSAVTSVIQEITVKTLPIRLMLKLRKFLTGHTVSYTHLDVYKRQGVDGAEQIQKIMEDLRNNVPSDFAGNKVIWAKDYKTGVFKNLLTGENEASTLPKSNVLYYNLDDRAWLCVRPSGTEPKIKFYMGVKADSLEKAVEKTYALVASVDELLKKIL